MAKHSTYTPGLNIDADCQPASGMMPASMDPLFKKYSFNVPSGSLTPKDTSMLDMMAGILTGY